MAKKTLIKSVLGDQEPQNVARRYETLADIIESDADWIASSEVCDDDLRDALLLAAEYLRAGIDKKRS